MSLSAKVDKLTEGVGPPSFVLTKAINVMYKIIFARTHHSQISQDNIKHVTRKTFLDPAVKDYKTEDTIKRLVIVSYRTCGIHLDSISQRLTSLQDKIRQSLDGIPKDLEQRNPQAWQQVESRVGYEVTQIRGAVKKVVSPALSQSCSVSLLIAY